MKKSIFIFLLFTFFISKAQIEILEKYPFGQYFYTGGLSEFYKDIRKVIKKNNLKPCKNEDEKYIASVLVYPDSKISFVKDFDTINIEKNKCAYDLSKNFLPYLKKWQPARLNNNKVKAIAQFTVDPYFLFNGKPKTNVYADKSVIATFEKGNSFFQKEVKGIIESYLKDNILGRKISIFFTINELGILENIHINNLQIEEIKEKQIISDIMKIRGKWKAGMHNGVPIKSNFHLSFEQDFNFEEEKQKFEEMEKRRNHF